jgi:hypothetical protein
MSDDDQNDQQDPGRLRQLIEEANARAAKAEADAAALKAKDVFRDAGLDPNKPLHQAVMKGYDGEMDTAAVKAYVADLGMNDNTPSPPPPQAPAMDPAEVAALNAMDDAQRGSGAPALEPDQREKLRQELEDLPWNAPPSQRNELLMRYSEAGGYKVVRE